MATMGNLELRLGNDTLYGSSTHDGYKVYKAVNMLADFLDNTPNPSVEQYKDWFKKTARELLPFRHSEELTGGVPCEVIIDASRKLLLYNTDNEERKKFVSDGAIGGLWWNHKYQTWRYNKLVGLGPE